MDERTLEEIINGCKAGNVKDQERLFNLYSETMFGVCLYYSRDTSEAEDLLHDGFLKIFQHIHTFRYQGSFEGWMRRIMVNTSLERFRKERHLYSLSDVENTLEDVMEENIIGQISTKDLVKLIQDLSPRYRMVFNLYAVEGYSHKEISRMMGITEGTSKSNLARARAILQRNVKHFFLTDSKTIK
ncbi:MAG TPA: sigma-70 family RNA polymerase sigma factor [Bacteroidales bacterium]|nr:sigma-70 family RNA polymerase sigma factor [Bacteroidales bacterium]